MISSCIAIHEHVTHIPLTRANGTVVCIAYLIQGVEEREVPDEWLGPHRSYAKAFFVKKGFLNAAVYEKVMDWFIEMIEWHCPNHRDYPDEPILLTCDNLRTHVNNPRVIRKLLDKNIHLFTFVPNMTHILQPNDLEINSSFNRIMENDMSITETANRILNSRTTLQDVLRAALEASRKMKPLTIIESFAHSCVFPPKHDPTKAWRDLGTFDY
jgi:hypothetical protein